MKAPLPTAKELEKLPMRAVVAYAARTARRVSLEFRGIVEDTIIDDALRLIDSVWTTDLISQIDPASVIRASECFVAAYEAAPAGVKSVERFRLLFSLVQAALAAMHALEAAIDPSNARHQMERAVQAAQRAVRPIEVLSNGAASAVREAARRDYDILLEKYGEHDEVVIGDPVDCFRADGETRKAVSDQNGASVS
jgi:hypothetical protein